jgi:hypothetical protein
VTGHADPCPCGDDCTLIVAECCGEDRHACITQTHHDYAVCGRGQGCAA